MKHKVSKKLHIGLGGSGIKTLLKLKKKLIQEFGEIPPSIGFLAYDPNYKSVLMKR